MVLTGLELATSRIQSERRIDWANLAAMKKKGSWKREVKFEHKVYTLRKSPHTKRENHVDLLLFSNSRLNITVQSRAWVDSCKGKELKRKYSTTTVEIATHLTSQKSG